MGLIHCDLSYFDKCTPFKVPFYQSPVLFIYIATIYIIVRIDDLAKAREYAKRID